MINGVSEIPRIFTSCDSSIYPIIHVPKDTDSLGKAVNMIGEHGRVILASGDYHENITIPSDSIITIQAADSSYPRLFAANLDQPAIRVAPQSSLLLNGISIHGAKFALVAGSRDNGEPANILTLYRTLVADAEFGIYGIVKRIHMEESVVEHNGYGLAIAGSASIVHTTVANNTFGLLIGNKIPSCIDATYVDCTNHVLIKSVNVSNNKQGGIAICNVASAVVDNVYVHKNAYIGVQIRNTPIFSLDNLRVGETFLWNGGWGDGLVVVHSSGIVKKSQFSANARANIIYYGKSGGNIDSNIIIYAIFAIDLEEQDGACPSPDITNNYMYGNQENHVTFGTTLCPAPLPQVPSL
jgi:hypothetical protein